jgi:CheY-like chemotaxis protein
MSDTTGFPLFDPNSDSNSSGHHNERFSSGVFDPDARERLAAMYRDHEHSGDAVAAPQVHAESGNQAPEGLESLLSRASSEAAAAPSAASPEDLVAEALAAVKNGTEEVAETRVESEADVQELVNEIRREQSLAEISEVAQNFVEEQTGDPVAAAEPNLETAGGPVEPATAQAVDPASNANAAPQEATPELPAASLASDVPWEPITEAAKRYEVNAGSAQVSPAFSASKTPASNQPERRRKRRALISAPLRVRTKNLTGHGLDEVATTVDVSRLGVLFQTTLDSYQRGMELMVTFPYSKVPHGIQAEQPGVVARIQEMENGKRRVAIVLGVNPGEHCVDAYGRKLGHTPVHLKLDNANNGMLGERHTKVDVKKPLVLAVDASPATRESLKACLQKEGYEVIALSSAAEGRDVLNVVTPALIFAEVEGEGLPGYDLCAHVKQNPRLRHIPVVLTTSSAYPSDYSSAHSLGAVVCMAKPYKMERVANIARLLAPPPSLTNNQFTPRPADPTRLPGRDCNVITRNGAGASKNGAAAHKNGNGKKSGADAKSLFKFPSFRTLSK